MTRRRIIVPMFAYYDGRAADPEHQRRQRRLIYVASFSHGVDFTFKLF
jgi:hypothetical protein